MNHHMHIPGFKQVPCTGAGCEVIPYVPNDTDPAAALCHGCLMQRKREKTMTTIETSTTDTQHQNGITEAPKRTRKARATVPPSAADGLSTQQLADRIAEARETLIARRAAVASELEHIDSLLEFTGGERETPAAMSAPATPSPRRPRKAAPKAKAAPRKKGARLARRSDEEIAEAVRKLVAVVGPHKDGLRAEQIRAELKLTAREMPRLLKAAVEQKLCKKSGAKRATVYQAR